MLANCHLENIKNMIPEIICTYFSSILMCQCIIVLPSLSAIKYAVTDNKTANINEQSYLSIYWTDFHDLFTKWKVFA